MIGQCQERIRPIRGQPSLTRLWTNWTLGLWPASEELEDTVSDLEMEGRLLILREKDLDLGVFSS